jgi:hypothetical protein
MHKANPWSVFVIRGNFQSFILVELISKPMVTQRVGDMKAFIEPINSNLAPSFSQLSVPTQIAAK